MPSAVRTVAAAGLVILTGFALAESPPAPKAATPAKSVPAILVVPATKPADTKATPAPAVTLADIVGGLVGGKPGKTPAQKQAEEKGTHEQGEAISIKSKDGRMTLQTLTVDADGRVLGLVGPPRGYGASPKGATAEVHVYDGAGKKAFDFKVDFHGQAINTAADGTIYVAGDGKVAKFDKAGNHLVTHKLPHIEKAMADTAGMRKEAEKELQAQKDSMKRTLELYEKRADEIRKIDADKRTAMQKRNLTNYEQILKSFKENEKFYATQTVDAIVEQKTGRLRIINGIAVSEKEVFVVCGESKGYGFAVWRTSLEFKDAKPVINNLSGCCGQMDVQCCGDDLVVAQNTNHQFGLFDRDGKKKGAFGKRGDATIDGFGGCCNPMNVRACGGSIYTAESEGLIKRFSDDGKFLDVVGYAPLTGGCKNVAVGVSPDGKRVYFTDQPGSRVIVMVKKDKKAAAAE